MCKSVYVFLTHHYNFGSEAHVVLPGDTQHIGQVEGEVDDASAGGCQVGTREERADEETLHDGHDAKGSQEQKHHSWIAVGQQVPHLRRGEKNIVSLLQQS